MAPTASQDSAVKSENSKALKALEELMSKLTVSKAQDEINASASAIATYINGDIEEADAPTKYVSLCYFTPPLPVYGINSATGLSTC